MYGEDCRKSMFVVCVPKVPVDSKSDDVTLLPPANTSFVADVDVVNIKDGKADIILAGMTAEAVEKAACKVLLGRPRSRVTEKMKDSKAYRRYLRIVKLIRHVIYVEDFVDAYDREVY